MDKAHFIYNHYIKRPLKKLLSLRNTVNDVARIINKIDGSSNIREISKTYTEKNRLNIHILCCHEHLESLILSLSSFYSLSREYADVIIHDDGTFTRSDYKTISGLFPWISFVTLQDADSKLSKKGFSSETIAARHKHKLLIKAVDFHHIHSEERILIIDSDIFLLGAMAELWDSVGCGAQLIFNSDPAPCYGSAKELIEKITGENITAGSFPYINTGLIVEPASILRKEQNIIDKYCRELEGFNFERLHAAEQGCIAFILKHRKISETALPSTYKIIGSRDLQQIDWLRKYDIGGNPDDIQTIHLCGWDKLGEDFRLVKSKLLQKMRHRHESRILS